MSFVGHRCVCGRIATLHDELSRAPGEVRAHRPRVLGDTGSEVVLTYGNGDGPVGGGVGEPVMTLIEPGEPVASFGRGRAPVTCGCDSCRTVYTEAIESGEFLRMVAA